jgi:phosphoglycolate phosphatase
MIELLMFDADGVLFDSYESNIAYYNAIFARIGEPPLDDQERLASISYAAGQVFEMRARGRREVLSRMYETARNLDSTPFFKLIRPPFELRPFMLELKRRYRLGLATNRSSTVAALVAHLGLADVFDAIASAHDKVRPKPAPDILALCLKRAGVTRERALYLGDSPIDREAAQAAGVEFLAVGDRVEHRNRIATLEELDAALARLDPADSLIASALKASSR